MENTALQVVTAGRAVDLAILAWLDSKEHLSGSARTRRAYQDTLASYRAALAEARYDLDAPRAEAALILQAWAGRGNPSPATRNHRLNVVSSFYTFAKRRGLLLVDNPAEGLERSKVQSYASAIPLKATSIQEAMRCIDRAPLQGKRDYALLSLALSTGRRLAELAALQWGDIETDGKSVTVTWRHCKGGKVMRDTLPSAIGRALLEYLAAFYGAGLGSLAHSAPIWIALDRGHYGRALSVRSISNVCYRILGVSKVHATRHTFAHAMEEAGAKVSEIQARLGHASLATTGRYLAALKSADNPHAETLVTMFGLN